MKYDYRETPAGKRRFKYKRFYRLTVWLQVLLWRCGIPWHNRFSDECSPDFNCCDRRRRETTLTDGSPVTPDHREIDPRTGMQKGYVVLSEQERAKGFVRPLRRSYRHVGARPKYELRELTDEEKARFADCDYAAFEIYPESESPKSGRYWTVEELGRKACGAVTTMSAPLSETYARDPKFYSGTFCAACGRHFSVEQFVWEGTSEVVGS